MIDVWRLAIRLKKDGGVRFDYERWHPEQRQFERERTGRDSYASLTTRFMAGSWSRARILRVWLHGRAGDGACA